MEVSRAVIVTLSSALIFLDGNNGNANLILHYGRPVMAKLYSNLGLYSLLPGRTYRARCINSTGALHTYCMSSKPCPLLPPPWQDLQSSVHKQHGGTAYKLYVQETLSTPTSPPFPSSVAVFSQCFALYAQSKE